MHYTPILATLGYVLSADRNEVLMIHRNTRPDDVHFGKYNGLGGKLERGEDVVTSLRREVYEEAGIVCETVHLAGTINWPGFGNDGEDWFGFIFRIERFSGTPRKSGAEGTLTWVPKDKLLELTLWEGDRHFLPLVFAEPLRQFHGVMPYKDGHPLSWNYFLVNWSKEYE
ncbi:MAG: 8-oxo-dGTP diphosphatase [Pseudomonadota bacterium]